MVFLVILIVLIALFQLARLVFYIRARRQNEISRRYRVSLGGVKQSILVEGQKSTLPVLVVLHGGPGVAFPFGEALRGVLPQLTKNFITVYWDQYGTGINYKKLPPKFSIADYDAMVSDLVRHVAAQYPDSPLYLFGMSFGTLLAANAAAAYGHLIDGVIAWGQVLSFSANNQIALHALGQCPLAPEDKKRLEQAQTLDTLAAKDIYDDLIEKYTNGATYKGADASAKFYKRLWPIIFSPDYGLLTHLRAQTGYKNIRQNTQILQQLAAAYVVETLETVAVPYHIIQGRHDLLTATPLVEEFVNATAYNPYLSLRVYEKSSHLPSGGDMQDLLQDLPVLVKA